MKDEKRGPWQAWTPPPPPPPLSEKGAGAGDFCREGGEGPSHRESELGLIEADLIFQQNLQSRTALARGSIYVKVPYSLIESEQWKTTVGKYKENPDKVVTLVERAINSQTPDWADLNSMLDTLLDPTER
ncbi:hypothetical protein Nmel_008253 [Mimus melanotis]